MELYARSISKKYGEKTVISDFTHRFADGSFTTVMGASGCGKTTLLHILAGIIKPDGGVIECPPEFRASAVFQENRLCENLTVSGNLRLLPKRPDKAVIAQELSRIGLEGCEGQTVRNLSGGMKRRVALLRALLAEYDILFLDEPFKGLDDETRERVMTYCKEKTAEKTVIMVTHDEEEARFFGGEVINI